MPAACRSSRYSSWVRMPSTTTSRRGSTAGGPRWPARSAWPRPVTRARSSPAAAPTYEALPGCRKSEWPSTKTSPTRPAESSARRRAWPARCRAGSSSRRRGSPETRRRRCMPRCGRRDAASTRRSGRRARRRRRAASRPGRSAAGSGSRRRGRRAARRRPWSRNAPGALAQPGTEVAVGGRSPRLDGASRTAIRRIALRVGLEQARRQGAARRGYRRVVGTGDGEQRDQVLAHPLTIVARRPAHQVDQPGCTPVRPAR